MKVQKASLTLNGNDIHISMPIVKVDKESRTVSGFATLDNVDTQGDLVTSEASKKAFSKWRGNIREMHEKKAVGRALKFEDRSYFNAEDGKTYTGVYVTAYISKGAQDTWEKVLDKTLTGFSIGGSAIKIVDVFDKDKGAAIRKVEDYEMHELSLVDNPANQLANVLSFQKVGGTVEADGLLTKMSLETIYWCPIDKVAVAAKADELVCSSCDNKMENIGWVEESDDEKAAVISKAVQTKTSDQPIAGTENTTGIVYETKQVDTNKIVDQVIERLKTEGGVDVSKRTLKKAAGETTDVEPQANVAAVAEGAPAAGPAATNADTPVEPASTAAPVSEVPELDLAKMFTDLRETLAGAIKDSKTDTEKALGDFKQAFEKSVGDISGKVSEFETQLGELSKQVNDIKGKQTTVEKAVETVVSETALRKSGDLGGSKAEKHEDTSFWHGSFLPADKIVA